MCHMHEPMRVQRIPCPHPPHFIGQTRSGSHFLDLPQDLTDIRVLAVLRWYALTTIRSLWLLKVAISYQK